MNTSTLNVSIQDRLGFDCTMRLMNSFGKEKIVSGTYDGRVPTHESNDQEKCAIEKDVNKFLSEIREKRQFVFEQTGKYVSLLHHVTLKPDPKGWRLYREVVGFIKKHRADRTLSNNQSNLLNRYLSRAKVSLLKARSKRLNEIKTAIDLAYRVNSLTDSNEFKTLKREIYTQIGSSLNQYDYYKYVVPAIVNTKFRLFNSHHQ